MNSLLRYELTNSGGMLTVRNYFITVIAGVLCLVSGASAESIGGRPGNEVGDFGEAPAGYRVKTKAARVRGSSIDLGGRLVPEDQVSHGPTKSGVTCPRDQNHYSAQRFTNRTSMIWLEP